MNMSKCISYLRRADGKCTECYKKCELSWSLFIKLAIEVNFFQMYGQISQMSSVVKICKKMFVQTELVCLKTFVWFDPL